MHTCKCNCKVLIGKKAIFKWNKRKSKIIKMSVGILEHQHVCTVTVIIQKSFIYLYLLFILRWICYLCSLITIKEHKTYNTVDSTASLYTQTAPTLLFSIPMCYQRTNMMFADVCLNRLDKSEFKWGSVEQQQNIMLQMEWKHRNHGLSLGWQINRYSGHSTDWIFVHGPCGSLAYLKVDAALRDWPALQLWENGKAWWSVGKVHQCCVSTYSQLQADLKNLQREKEIRLQTQQKWAISTPTASLDADWLILSQIWTFSS